MIRLKHFILDHFYISVYLAVFSTIYLGLFWLNAFELLTYLTGYFLLPFLAIYIIANRLKTLKLPSFSFNTNWITLGLGFVAFLLISSHFYDLGGIPVIQAYNSQIQSEVNQIRTSIASVSTGIWAYLYAWNLKVFLPFLLLIASHKKRYSLLVIFGIIATFYAFSLLQKSHIVWIWAPTLIYAIFQRFWLLSGLSLLIVITVLGSLVWVTNARLRGGVNDVSKVQNSSSTGSEISGGLMRRIFIVPSEMVNGWYQTIPEKKPFLYGKDFGLYCKLTNQKCSDYAKELYPIIYPEYAERGLTGSVNAAHFMRSYANFGFFGFFLAAILLNLILLMCKNTESKQNRKIAFALHFFPLVLSGSGSVFTLLMSGGWAITMVLLFLYKNDFESK